MSKYHREYKKLYDTSRWRKLRTYQLRAQPLCEQCRKKGLSVAAEVVHHVTPHKGDPILFFTGELQSLCKSCHDHETGQVEQHGYDNAIGLDGWPTDDRHPVYNYEYGRQY